MGIRKIFMDERPIELDIELWVEAYQMFEKLKCLGTPENSFFKNSKKLQTF